MHIVIITDLSPSTVGGVQTSVNAQRRGLLALGHKVTIICPALPGSDTSILDYVLIPTLPILKIDGSGVVLPTRRTLQKMNELIDALPPIDVIHIQYDAGVSILGAVIARNRSIPLVQTMHGRDDVFMEKTVLFSGILSWVMKRIHQHWLGLPVALYDKGLSFTARNAWSVMVAQAQAADHVVVPSHHFKNKFIERGLTVPVSVISNGLDSQTLASFTPAPAGSTPNTPLKVLWCGRMSSEKRPEVCVDAVVIAGDCQLDMYGNGEGMAGIKKKIEAIDDPSKVVLHGSVDQNTILQAMSSSDVLVYSSYGFDNQPMVLLEAVAAGLPVIYCDSDLTECMPVGGCVLTTSPDASAIAVAIRTLADDSAQIPKLRKCMLDARSTVDQTTHSARAVELYKSLILRNTQKNKSTI